MHLTLFWFECEIMLEPVQEPTTTRQWGSIKSIYVTIKRHSTENAYGAGWQELSVFNEWDVVYGFLINNPVRKQSELQMRTQQLLHFMSKRRRTGCLRQCPWVHVHLCLIKESSFYYIYPSTHTITLNYICHFDIIKTICIVWG